MNIHDGRIYMKIGFDDYADRSKAMSIVGHKWEPELTMWSFPLSEKNRLTKLFPRLEQGMSAEIDKYKTSVRKMRKDVERIKNNIAFDISIFKREPKSHQITMLKNFLADRYHALLCDPGTGKSQPVINAYEYLLREGLVSKCLIICTKTAMDSWEEEIEDVCNLLSIQISGTKEQRLKKLATKNNFYIINYSGLNVLKKYEHWHEFDMVIVDESQHVKNPKALQTQYIINWFKRSKFRVILSGTPIEKDPVDLWCQFNFLNPGYFNMDYYDFRDRYCIMGGYENKNIIGYKNLRELKYKISLHSTQMKKEECLDIPEKVYQKRSIEMSRELKKQYDEMEKTGELKLASGDILTAKKKEVIAISGRLRQILSGVFLTNHKNNKKLIELSEMLNDYLYANNSIIIWCRYRKSMDLIENLLRSGKVPYSLLHGDVRDRQKERLKFQEGITKVMLGQIDIGESITLTKGTIVIYYENSFSLIKRRQTEDRSHRIGQTNKVLYIDLVYKNTIEWAVMKAIKDKQDIATYLVKSFKKGKY